MSVVAIAVAVTTVAIASSNSSSNSSSSNNRSSTVCTSLSRLTVVSHETGGAWDNAKKWVEKGNLGPNKMKGTKNHEAVVVGDTIGDPFKDTSGPSLNILIKLMSIVSLVIVPVTSLFFLSLSLSLSLSRSLSLSSLPAIVSI